MKGRHGPRRLESHTEGHGQQQSAPFKAWGAGRHCAWSIYLLLPQINNA